MRKPNRPYRTFAHFIDVIAWAELGSWTSRRPGKWPCLTCHGHGWTYDPCDPPCPVEGNQYRLRLKCPSCKGSGEGPKEACRQAYQAILDDYQRKLRAYRQLLALKKQALQKLTKEERTAIATLGID